jgi:outer membrane beta-barrel protein
VISPDKTMDVKVMSTMKRLGITGLAITAVLAALGSTGARAQEVQVEGPLAGAPAVIGLRVYRQMRFQIQLHGTVTLEDEFSRAILPGGQLMFHPTDWLGIGIWGGFAAGNIDSALTDEVSEKGQTNEVNVLSLPSAANFAAQIGRIQWMAAPQVSFIPLRGKLGIFEKLFVDTDFYVFGGVGIAGVEERTDVPFDFAENCRSRGDLAAQIECFLPTQEARTTRVAIAPTFGAGISLYLADYLAMTLEWRGLPFAWNTSGTDESGNALGDYPDNQINSDDQLSHFNHMFTLGFAFYLPTAPRISSLDAE